MKEFKGFTLIEILIALSVFAILASLTSSSLYQAFRTRTIVNAQMARLSTLQLAVSIMQQDVAQLIPRAIRGNEMRLFPAMVGQPDYVEFTRQGYVNPRSMQKRSTLKRVAFACLGGKLVHRSWKSLDPKDRNDYHDKVIVDKVDDCNFKYLNKSLQTLDEWREQSVSHPQKQAQQSQQPPQEPEPIELLPKAIQVNLKLKDWGKMNLLFIISEGLYAST